MILLELFWAFLKVGLFAIGGGLAAIPLIQDEVVTAHGWVTFGEFTELISIAQMTPGPIAINAATFIGMRMYGVLGALVATTAFVIPSVAIVSLLMYLHNRHKELDFVQGILSGLRPAVVGLIAAAGLKILQYALFEQETFVFEISNLNWIAVGLFGISLFVLRKWKVNPLWIMLMTGVIGGALYLWI